MARPARTRRRIGKKRAKGDTTQQSVDFVNNLTWHSEDENDAANSHEQQLHDDLTSRPRSSTNSSLHDNVFEVPESPGSESWRSSHRSLPQRGNQAEPDKTSITSSDAGRSNSIDSDSGGEKLDAIEETNQSEPMAGIVPSTSHNASVTDSLFFTDAEEANNTDDDDVEERPGLNAEVKSEQHSDLSEDEHQNDDESESNEHSPGPDSDGEMSESARQLEEENNFNTNFTVEVAIPPSAALRNSRSNKLNYATGSHENTQDSDKEEREESGYEGTSGEESERAEESDLPSGSEYRTSESEQSDSEQDRYETPPQQVINSRRDTAAKSNGAVLRRTTRAKKVVRQPQAERVPRWSSKNLKRKERPSLNEPPAKGRRRVVHGSARHSTSADSSSSFRQATGFSQWEYEMEVEDAPHDGAAVDGADPLFKEATQVMGLQRSWERFMSGLYELRTGNTSKGPFFLGLERLRGLICSLQNVYKEMQEDRRTGTISIDLETDRKRHADLVREHTNKALTKLVKRANAAQEADSWTMKLEASALAEQIAVNVITELGDLAKECLKAYYSDSTLADGGFVDILGILDMIRQLDSKIFSIKSCYRIYVANDYGRNIRAPLNTLWKRLSQGEFYARQQKRPAPILPRRRPWTEDEEMMLLEGLQLYEGEEHRFQYLAEDCADELGGRTEAEIREKARELYDDYLGAKNVSLTWLMDD